MTEFQRTYNIYYFSPTTVIMPPPDGGRRTSVVCYVCRFIQPYYIFLYNIIIIISCYIIILYFILEIVHVSFYITRYNRGLRAVDRVRRGHLSPLTFLQRVFRPPANPLVICYREHIMIMIIIIRHRCTPWNRAVTTRRRDRGRVTLDARERSTGHHSRTAAILAHVIRFCGATPSVYRFHVIKHARGYIIIIIIYVMCVYVCQTPTFNVPNIAYNKYCFYRRRR